MKTSLHSHFPWVLSLALTGLLAVANAFGAGYADAVQADGPIAYWRFNDATPVALNSGSLGVAVNGTYHGDAAPGAPAPRPPSFAGFETNNTAVQLDGTGDFVGTISGLLNNRTNLTISGWIRRNADQPNRTGLWGQNDVVELGYIENDLLHAWTWTGFVLNVSPNPFPNGKWGHLALVISNTSFDTCAVSLYTNGQFAVSMNAPLPATNAFAFNIGGGGVFDGTGNFFNGQIDEVAVFDKALSAEQIASHYIAAVGVLQTGFAFSVTTTSDHDDGRCSVADCTLLEALNAANADPNGNMISFQPGLSGTITNSGLPNGYPIVNSVTVFGPGADVLTISGNNANRVFRLSGASDTLSGLTIANGMAAEYGGGILVDAGQHAIYDCRIVSNAAGLGGGGVFIRSNAVLTLNYSSVTHNQAVLLGGGIAQAESAQVFIWTSTIASNRTTFQPNEFLFPRGGGIELTAGSLFVVNSTIAGNSSTSIGGGIANVWTPGTAEIRNSIIAGNSAPLFGPDVGGPFLSSGYNLIGNTANGTGFTNTSDQLNVNPLLGPLANYGGPTLTMALQSGSPAIDKGKNFGQPNDQRGFPRPLDDLAIANASGGDGADIGAFEVDPNFRIMDIRRTGNDVALSLMTVLGKNYRAEYTNDLASGTWTIFTNNIPGNGWLLWVTNSGGANQPRRFYRGAILP